MVTGLSPGVTYEFKVESRNGYDFSSYSDTIQILCAFVPDPPVLTNDLSTTTDEVIRITWPAPFDGGVPILDYSV